MLNAEKVRGVKSIGVPKSVLKTALQNSTVYQDAYAASPSAKIIQIKSGIPATRVKL
jgi:hypothetical protein